MRRIAISLLIISLSAFSLFAQYKGGGDYSILYDSEPVKAFKNHISFISSKSMCGRASGSEGEKTTAIYFEEILKSYGLDILTPRDGDIFGVNRANGDTLISRNVAAVITGQDKILRDRYIVIGARLDNLGRDSVNVNGTFQERIYYGANGNASGLAMLMELAGMLKTNSSLLKRSVILVGFGSSCSGFAGSWYFLNRSFVASDKIDAMINLDMLGTGYSGFYGFTSSNADMNRIANSLSSTLQPIHPEITSLEPYPSDHKVFYAKQIPSILFTTGYYKEHNTEADRDNIIDYELMERELEYIYSYSVALINGPAPVFNPSEFLKKKHSSISSVVPYYDCDEKPSFLGRVNLDYFMQKWVYYYLRYPESAIRDGVQGKVLVNFVISDKGKVKDVKVLKGCDERLDNEALRVVSASPDWKPGKIRGEKVSSEISLYVEFRIKKNN